MWGFVADSQKSVQGVHVIHPCVLVFIGSVSPDSQSELMLSSSGRLNPG
jgi:hypothetical protein